MWDITYAGYNYYKHIHNLTELKGEIGCSTIIAGDFNNPLSIMNTTTKQITNKETEDLNNTIHQLDLAEIQNTPPPKSRIHIFC